MNRRPVTSFLTFVLSLSSSMALAGPLFMGVGGTVPGEPGITSTTARAISADGKFMVGDIDTASGGFRWSIESGFEIIPDAIRATGVSADGHYVIGADGAGRGFRWASDTGMQLLGDLPGGVNRTEPTDISDDGSVVVGWSSSTQFPGSTISRYADPFRWTETNGIQSIALIPNTFNYQPVGTGRVAASADASVLAGGDAASVISTTPDVDALRWTAETGFLTLDHSYEFVNHVASDVSGDGSVIVGYFGGTFPAFRWTADDGLVLLDAPISMPRTNQDGSVIVGTYTNEAMIWTADSGTRRLVDLLIELGLGAEVAGWDLSSATGISADGRTIVGWGSSPTEGRQAWIAVIPEASSLQLTLAASLLLACLILQRRIAAE